MSGFFPLPRRSGFLSEDDLGSWLVGPDLVTFVSALTLPCHAAPSCGIDANFPGLLLGWQLPVGLVTWFHHCGNPLAVRGRLLAGLRRLTSCRLPMGFFASHGLPGPTAPGRLGVSHGGWPSWDVAWLSTAPHRVQPGLAQCFPKKKMNFLRFLSKFP